MDLWLTKMIKSIKIIFKWRFTACLFKLEKKNYDFNKAAYASQKLEDVNGL